MDGALSGGPVRVAQYATARLLRAAVFTVLVVGETTIWIYAVGAGVDVETLVLTGVLGLLSFIALALALLYDARRRHQLRRALRSHWASWRLLIRVQAAGPAPVGAIPGAALFEVGRRSGVPSRDAVHEVPTYETAPVLEDVSVPRTLTVREPGQQRLPASPRVAQGAPMVRLTTARYHQSIRLATARTRLIRLRQADERSGRRATMSRWAVRAALLLLVPALLTHQMRTRSSWFGGVWDGGVGRVGFVAALALGVAGSVWTIRVTNRRHGGRLGPLTLAESHAIRSRSAVEQLALRLAVGSAPSEAWHTVALTNHIAVRSANPAAATEEALLLVERLRGEARSGDLRPVPLRIIVVAAPLLACLLPASVIILLL
jgi:hypothetical protein